MYLATVNVPGYLPNNEGQEFDHVYQAWTYLIDERNRDLDDPMNDEDSDWDDAIDEMEGMATDNVVGTVYGRTPGYDADHDLGLAYRVVEL